MTTAEFIFGETLFALFTAVLVQEVRHSLRTGRSWLKYSFVDREKQPRFFQASLVLNAALAIVGLFGCVKLLWDFCNR